MADPIVTVRLDPASKKQLDAIAKNEDRTISYIIRRIIRQFLGGQKK